MALPNPIYIDAEALHPASAVRLLAFASLEGQEGVIENTDLRILAKTAATNAIDVMPGAYVVRAKHTGGEKESYAGKVLTAESVTVNPTTSASGRTDLVILRVENPYVSGAGAWAQPVDPVGGPYAHIRVIEGVPANTQSVVAHNNTWSAITLGRIFRGPNRTTVEQADITDLRQIASLQNERIIIINNPPATPPPIAYPVYTESSLCSVTGSGEMASTQTAWKKFPADLNWKVPVPTWARGMDVMVLFNPQVNGHVWCEGRLVVDGQPTGATPTMIDINYVAGSQPGPIQALMHIGGTESVKAAWGGREVNVHLEFRMLDPVNHPGKITCSRGTYATVLLNFKKKPVYD